MNLRALDKNWAILILAAIFGFIFRFVNIKTRVLLGDPPHFLVHAIDFLDSGLLIIWDQSTYLWYALTNIFYNLFGITQFASRLSSLLFGTLAIFTVFLFTYEFSKNKKIALITAILFAFAPGIIWHTADEHDMSALFFISFTFYSLVKGLDKKSNFYMFASAVLFGISFMWKAYVAILIIPYLGLILFNYWENKKSLKKEYPNLLKIFLIMFLLVSPTLIYNYSNYKHNEVVDFLFAKTFPALRNEKTEQLYGWTSAQEMRIAGNILSRLFIDGNTLSESDNTPLIYYGVTHSLLDNGPVLWTLILIGFLLMFFNRKKDPFAKKYLIFFSIYFFIPFLFLVDGNYLSKHYIHFLAFGLPIAAYALNFGYERYLEKSDLAKKFAGKKNSEYIVFSLIVLFVFFVLMSRVTSQWGSFFSANPQDEFIKYKLSNIERDSLIIYDDRIYNSEAAWLFNDRYFIPVSGLNSFFAINGESTNKKEVSVFIIECGIDQCGWPIPAEFNKSMEDFFTGVKNDSSIDKVFSVNDKLTGVNYYNPILSKNIESPPYLTIYKTSLPVDLNLAEKVKLQYEYFLYPLAYKNKESPNYKLFLYEPTGAFEKLINKFAWLIFYVDILISFLAILFLFFEMRLLYYNHFSDSK